MLSIVLAGSLALAQGVPIPDRPRDPFVFRSVLDKRARMVTIALSNEMWIAYDATTCSMYKAWKGNVHFDGAVYTTVHGPQPTSVGESYTIGPPGDVWSARIGGKETAVRAEWRGYELHGGRVHLNYELILADGRHITMQETPEYVTTADVLPPSVIDERALVLGMPGLYRSFSADQVPDDVELHLRVYTENVAGKFPYPPNGLGEEKDVDVDGVRHMQSFVTFDDEMIRPNLVLFFEPLPDLPVPDVDAKR